MFYLGRQVRLSLYVRNTKLTKFPEPRLNCGAFTNSFDFKFLTFEFAEFDPKMAAGDWRKQNRCQTIRGNTFANMNIYQHFIPLKMLRML